MKFHYKKKENFVMFSTNRVLKIKFSEITVEEHWIYVQIEWKIVSAKRLKYYYDHQRGTYAN